MTKCDAGAFMTWRGNVDTRISPHAFVCQPEAAASGESVLNPAALKIISVKCWLVVTPNITRFQSKVFTSGIVRVSCCVSITRRLACQE